MSDIGATAAATAAAVTGEGTPDTVKVTKPAQSAVWSLFLALAIICVVVGSVIAILTWAPWQPGSEMRRIWFIGWIGIVAVGCIPLIVFALASPWVGQVKATAGPVSIDASGR